MFHFPLNMAPFCRAIPYREKNRKEHEGSTADGHAPGTSHLLRTAEDNPLLCSPNPHNITPIYASLMSFIDVIERALKLEPGYDQLTIALK